MKNNQELSLSTESCLKFLFSNVYETNSFSVVMPYVCRRAFPHGITERVKAIFEQKFVRKWHVEKICQGDFCSDCYNQARLETIRPVYVQANFQKSLFKVKMKSKDKTSDEMGQSSVSGYHNRKTISKYIPFHWIDLKVQKKLK